MEKYIDTYVQIAFAKADIMVIEENKNSLFGTRENVSYFMCLSLRLAS